MEKIYLLFFWLFTVTMGFAQDSTTLCHTPPTEKFAAPDKNVKAEHARPRYYVPVSGDVGGELIKFKCPDGAEANGYVIMAKTKTNNWIFVFQESWGLNEYIKKQSEQLYTDLGNVNVLALDMYDGIISADTATTAKYMQEFKQEKGDAIVKGALDYAGQDAKVGTIGWSFGGGQSLQAAITMGKSAIACVMYYGMPEDNTARLKSLECDVLDIWATQDNSVSKEVTDKFEANMKAAGKELIVKSYDEPYGFANPNNPIYNKYASRDAYKSTLEFLQARVK